MKKLLFMLLLPLTSLLPTTILASDTAFNNVSENVFWPKIYNQKYHTLYCAVSRNNTQIMAEKVAVDQVYPTRWIADANGCSDKQSCDVEAYVNASSDLHHMWPALPKYKNLRGQLPFIEVTIDASVIDPGCDFSQSSKGVEPRNYAKGEIARSFLYQLWKYKLPHHDLLPLMVKWSNKYAPSTEEKWRNDKIEKVQGNRNPFIDDAGLADIFASIQ